MLYNCSIRHGAGTNPKSECDTADWLEGNVRLAECWVDDTIDKRNEDDDSNWVEILHQVIRNTVTGHLSSLRNEVVAELAIAHPVNGIDKEDFTTNKCSFKFLDKFVTPRYGLG